MDLYEFVTFLVFISLGAIGAMILLKIPDGTFDHISDVRNAVIGIGWFISGLVLIKFDSNSRKRAREQFDYDLAEYEMIRTRWLDLEASKLELQKQYSTQMIVTESPQMVEIPSPPKEVNDTQNN